MKHINESIRNKRGYDPSPKGMLRQGDIVYFYKNPDVPYMYISDADIVDKIFKDGKLNYNYSEGVFVVYVQNMNRSFFLLSDYDNNLTLKDKNFENRYDVKSVWCGNINISPRDNIYEILKESNLKALVKSYKKIWER